MKLPVAISALVGLTGLSRWMNAAPIGRPLVVVPDPPLVQMLVPGFEARELPA